MQGITETIQKTMSAEERKEFQGWVRQANNLVETSLFEDSDVIPLENGTPIFAYAKDSANYWVTYKRRSKLGSINAKDAERDFDRSIKLAKILLKKTPTERNEPIQEPVTTDFGEQYQISYSQTQGYPPDFLY